MKRMYGYIRVSTQRQGEGASLDMQRQAIETHAKNNNHIITRWFEEKCTAAKEGRPTFTQMLTLLKRKEADGVIIHKIDRSTRNLSDWVTIIDALEEGINIEFAHENIDLNSRGGRLSANFQAIIATDYIYNLRQETLKGIRGRLEQGLLPNNAPVGYLNTGSGNVKAIDPVRGPLMKKAFEKYATGNYSVNEVRMMFFDDGLKRPSGKTISNSSFSCLLRNPFYMGIIKLKSTGETFEGKHTPLVSAKVFDKVQQHLDGKIRHKHIRHDFLFKRRISCKLCERKLYGELQRGRVYYRCQTKGCPTTSVREDHLENLVEKFLGRLTLPKKIRDELQQHYKSLNATIEQKNKKEGKVIELSIGKERAHMKRLEEKFIDDLISNETYLNHRENTLKKIKSLENKQRNIAKKPHSKVTKDANLEFLNNVLEIYKKAGIEQKRDLLEEIFSNFYGELRKPLIQAKKTPSDLVNLRSLLTCSPRTHGTSIMCVDCTVIDKKVCDEELISKYAKIIF